MKYKDFITNKSEKNISSIKYKPMDHYNNLKIFDDKISFKSSTKSHFSLLNTALGNDG